MSESSLPLAPCPSPLFSSDVKWIWLPRPQRAKNSYACFRRTIELDAIPSSAKLRVTADSRYELWINGTFIGHGPVRSWPSPWPVDVYDIRHLLRPGKNAIGLLVTHIGLSTFQYLDDEPGLIASIDLDGEQIVTNAAWRCTAHDGYLWPVPRVACQQGWEEQFDARIAPGLPSEWSSAAFDDANWQTARELRAAGESPHPQFEPRSIPMLTHEPVDPVSIRKIDVVRPANYHFSVNPRELANAIDKSANHILARMLLATFIHSSCEQSIDLHAPHTRPKFPWKLNAEELNFDDHSLQYTDTGVAHAMLKKGWNQLLCRLPESEHLFWATLNVWTQEPVKFAAHPSEATQASSWLALGPFAGGRTRHVFDEIAILPTHIDPAATAEQFEKIWAHGMATEADLAAPFAHVLSADMVATQDVYAECASDRAIPSSKPVVEESSALLDDNADWTMIYPPGEGECVRILLDFGVERVGFQEFEIDAPAGTIVDTCNFEFIQRDGRFNLNDSMNDSFRYICREGVQRYKSFIRRALKFTWLTLRRFAQPVRIRFVRVLGSTYPQAAQGAFECSDPMLQEIWNVGVRSVRCCSEDTYTDCPTFEQTLWVGDARNEALVDLVANGDPRLSARCLRLTGRSLDRSPITESQVPSGWKNLLPTWTFLWMRWAQEHYQLVGDRTFGKEMLGYLDRNIAGMRNAINDRGLFEMFAWNLFDWAGMDTPADGIVTHVNCFASLGLRQSAMLANSLGDEGRAKKWNQFADDLAGAVNRHLWSDDMQAYVDCIRKDGSLSPVFSQQTQTAAYISGVASGDRASRCNAIIHHPPENFVKAGSPFFMFFLLEALVRERKFDALIDTIGGYWGKQIDAGATTFWEMYHEDGPRLTRSHCHGWSAAPTYFLTQHVLGVQPLDPGYATILIAPKTGALRWAQGRVPTPHGNASCYWKRDGKDFELTIDTPANVPVRIELPMKGTVEILEGDVNLQADVALSKGGFVKLRVRS